MEFASISDRHASRSFLVTRARQLQAGAPFKRERAADPGAVENDTRACPANNGVDKGQSP